VDVIEIDAATNRGIDEIRELREATRYRPARDRFKIYILDEAHQITDAAFNALLKTLESRLGMWFSCWRLRLRRTFRRQFVRAASISVFER
jgi:replication-associated recombination protein RarA